MILFYILFIYLFIRVFYFYLYFSQRKGMLCIYVYRILLMSFVLSVEQISMGENTDMLHHQQNIYFTDLLHIQWNLFHGLNYTYYVIPDLQLCSLLFVVSCTLLYTVLSTVFRVLIVLVNYLILQNIVLFIHSLYS